MVRGGSLGLDSMMCEQVLNQIGSELTALICDQLSWIPELVEYVSLKNSATFSSIVVLIFFVSAHFVS